MKSDGSGDRTPKLLKLLNRQSASNRCLGKGPQALAILPGSELLLCANMPGNNVAVFRIDSQTGGLKSVGELIAITSPSCIMILK